MRRILFAAVVAACFLLPALAAGEDDAGSSEHAGCGTGTVLAASSDGSNCPGESEDAAGDEPSSEDLPLDDSDDVPSQPSNEDAIGADEPKTRRGQFDKPRFKAAFLNRAWRIIGEANGYHAGVLDLTAERFKHLPRRWANQDDSIVGKDARVLVGSKTRVYDADRRRLLGAATAAALDEAIEVTVIAKILPPAKWKQDEDGTPVPTLRAKRVTIVE